MPSNYPKIAYSILGMFFLLTIVYGNISDSLKISSLHSGTQNLNYTDAFDINIDKENIDSGYYILEDSYFTLSKSYKVNNFEYTYFEKPLEYFYIVQNDDENIFNIASKLGQEVNILIYNNQKNIKDFNNLKIGDQIKYYTENGIFYEVKNENETINDIANKYAVTMEDLLKYNNLQHPLLKTGQLLFIKDPYIVFYTVKSDDVQKKLEEDIQKERIAKLIAEKERRKKEEKALEDERKKRLENIKKNIEYENSRFIMPVVWRGITSPFGSRLHPVLKKYIFHKGIDLKANYTKLYAPDDGKVIRAGWVSGYGKIIIIKHSNNYETRMAHLDKIDVKLGSKVKKGQLIGKTGKTGRVTGPHLHYEIRKNGKPLNPLNYYNLN